MAQRESSAEREQNSVLSVIPPEVSSMGQKRIEEFANLQAELLKKLEDSNKQWVERMQSEIHLSSELLSKLTSVRSFPDAATACQEWSSHRLQMIAEDGSHLFSDAQTFMQAGARLLSVGWRPNGRGDST